MAEQARRVLLSVMNFGRYQLHQLQKRVAAVGKEEFTEDGRGVVAVLAWLLGIGVGVGITLFFLSENYWDFGLYLAFLCSFHLSEFILVALYNRNDLTANSFLINHSDAYTLAAAACILEYTLEQMVLPFLKCNWFIAYIGVGMAAFGFTVRVVAMVTAGHNFTHIVQEEKRDAHELVTGGIYSISRHPGYMGWFVYTVGTQVILANPLCTAAFAYVSFQFFKDRIEYEEVALVEMFGESYVTYRAKTPTLIPGIK